MKEFNIEQKAKAYDKAIERAEGLIDFCSDSELKTLEYVFPELRESEDERIRKELLEHCKNQAKPYIQTGNKCPQIQSWIAWLEKQGEQKPTDTVDPKFKVGDWVVYNRNDSSIEILYVYDIRDGRYYFNDNIHFSWSVKECDEKCHLWSIKDAKNGDVLAEDPIEGYPSSFVAIYKKQNEEDFDTFDSYCFVGFDGKFYDGEYGHSSADIHPAIKEQRELLFEKMHEAVYTFDFDKKELKKIESKHSWSYEDEANLNNIIWLCNNCINGSETTWIPSQATKIKHLIETIKEKGLTQ